MHITDPQSRGHAASTSPSYAETYTALRAIGQEHLLHFFDQLPEERQQDLLSQIHALDLASLPRLIDRYVKNPEKSTPAAVVGANLRPVNPYPLDAANPRKPWDRSTYQKIGEDLLRAGKVAAFVVAGGQGSRLGYDGPKGCYTCGPVTHRSLFEMFAANLVGAKKRYGRDVPWYIMTSPLNHRATVGFFEDHHYFGLERYNVLFFQQGVMPSLDMKTGRVLLSRHDEVATNPDGHGGAIAALKKSGAIEDMKRRGIEHLSYFQVDNPLVRVLDPVFLGLHAAAPDSSGEMSSKMVAKASPEEKVGVFATVSRGGREVVDVVEYSDFPPALARERGPDGTLAYNAGSIAVHIIGVSFLDKLANDPSFELPFHRAEKKVACVDLDSGEVMQPQSNNAVKLEKFVFDALPLCKASIVVETSREEFAPIKNATGVDSPESCQQLQTLRAARWLELAGVKVAKKPDGTPDCVLEIRPEHATSADELKQLALPKTIEAGAKLVL
ncbi:MAG TPA: UDPGP type 1 family protein [Phycisphaerales bacterium]